MVKLLRFAMRIPGHVQPVGWPCGTWLHYAMRDVKDVGEQMGYRSLEWNRDLLGQELLMEPSCFNLIV